MFINMSDRLSLEQQIKKILDRFLRNSDQDGECKLWRGKARNSSGRYGRVCLTYPGDGQPKAVQTSVSRAVYVLDRRRPDILQNPEAGDVSHRCLNTLCINPRHLTLESRVLNSQRRSCQQGIKEACSCVPPCILQT